jgi:hypothetical protein
MRRIRVYVGLALMAASIFVGLWAVLALARYGSCASGGVYVSARECAPGTGLKIVLTTFSVFGTLIGAALTMSGRAGVSAFGLVFGMLASYFFVTAFGADLSPAGYSSNSSALIAAIVCTVIALPLLWFAVRPGTPDARRVVELQGRLGSVRRAEDGGPAAVVLAGVGPGAGGPAPFAAGGAYVSPMTGTSSAATATEAPRGSALAQQLEALAELRRTGVIDDADFERGKRKLLGG